MKMAGGVMIRGRIATANVPTGHAQAQMHPGASDSQTIFATASTRRDSLNLVKMGADLCHDGYLDATQAAGKVPALVA